MKKPQTKKSVGRKPKPAKARKPDKSAAAKAAVGHNSADPNVRALFLQHKEKVDRLKQQATAANGKLRAAYKEAKKDAFEQYMFDTARQLETPEGEAEFLTKLGRQVQAAQFVGSTQVAKIAQLDLFEVDRTDAAERAYDEGQKQSMENKAAKPSYAPGTAQYESYMKGFHDHQAGIAKGFQSIDKGAKTKQPSPPRATQAAAKAAQEAAEQTDAPALANANPASGQGMSRAEYNRLQAEQGRPEMSESQFSRRVN